MITVVDVPLIHYIKDFCCSFSLTSTPFRDQELYPQVALYQDIEDAVYNDDFLYNKLEDLLESFDDLSEYIESGGETRTFPPQEFELMSFASYKSDPRHKDLTFPPLDVNQHPKAFLIVYIPNQGAHDLSLEINQLYKSLLPKPEDITKRQNIVQRIENIIGGAWNQNYKVKVYGSSANGFGFRDSDMDLAIVAPEYDYPWINKRKESRKQHSIMNMHRLAFILRNSGMINVMPVPNANVPICKFDVLPHRIHCDISVNNLMSSTNTRLLKAYSELDPRVRPFIYAIKEFVKRRNINDASNGSLSSYSYTLMGLWYLMTCDPPVIPNLQNPKDFFEGQCNTEDCNSHTKNMVETEYKHSYIHCNISFHDCFKRTSLKRNGFKEIRYTRNGTFWATRNVAKLDQLLIDFFYYYGTRHNFNRAISIRLNRSMFKRNQWDNQPIAIEDPFITRRNVGTSCHKKELALIKRLFSATAHTLATKRFSFASVCSMLYSDLVKAGSLKMAKMTTLGRCQADRLPIEKAVIISDVPYYYERDMVTDMVMSELSVYGEIESIKRWKLYRKEGSKNYIVNISNFDPFVLLPVTIPSMDQENVSFDVTEYYEIFPNYYN